MPETPKEMKHITKKFENGNLILTCSCGEKSTIYAGLTKQTVIRSASWFEKDHAKCAEKQK